MSRHFLTWLRHRNHIHCPYCGADITPEVEGFTNGTPDGQWNCDNCLAEFTLVLTGLNGESYPEARS